jgi:hypothetical protein
MDTDKMQRQETETEEIKLFGNVAGYTTMDKIRNTAIETN